jgi:hypothetical protein
VIAVTDYFEKPELLQLILDEFKESHIGDERELLFIFHSNCSSRLPPQFRFSTATIGDSSVGKTNANITVLNDFPDKWHLKMDSPSRPFLEKTLTDNEDCRILFLKDTDGKADPQLKNLLHALVEDGYEFGKMDTATRFSSTKEGKIPRLVGNYCTTGSIYDEELQNRYCVVSIQGSPAKTATINIKTKKFYSDPRQQIHIAKKKEDSWIKKSLLDLESFDVIAIPGVEMIEEQVEKPRSRRDLKRFLNLVCSIAWLYQKQRKTEKIDGKKVLFAHPVDVYNAIEIGGPIFTQSYTQLDGRLRENYEKIQDLYGKKGSAYSIVDGGAVNWIQRIEVQHELGYKTANTVKNQMQKLEDLGLIVQHKTKNMVYIRPVFAPKLPIKGTSFIKGTAEDNYNKIKGRLPGIYGADSGQVMGKTIQFNRSKIKLPSIK